MPRANSTVPRHRRHRKIVKLAKGYYGTRKTNFKSAKVTAKFVAIVVLPHPPLPFITSILRALLTIICS